MGLHGQHLARSMTGSLECWVIFRSRVFDGALLLVRVLGPLLDLEICPLEIAVVLLEEVRLPLLRRGGRPLALSLLCVVLSGVGGCSGLVSGIWVLSLTSSWGLFSTGGSGIIKFPAWERNSGKLLRVSGRKGFDSNGADVPVGEGNSFHMHSSGRIFSWSEIRGSRSSVSKKTIGWVDSESAVWSFRVLIWLRVGGVSEMTESPSRYPLFKSCLRSKFDGTRGNLSGWL